MDWKKDDLMYIAKIAHNLNRDKDEIDAVKKLVTMGNITLEERECFTSAYHFVVVNNRSFRRKLRDQEKAEIAERNTNNAYFARKYIKRVDAELSDICFEFLEQLDKYFIPTDDLETKHFYYRYRALYNSHLARVMPNRDDYIAEALSHFEKGAILGEEIYSPANHFRMHLIRDMAEFYAEILGNTQRAAEMVKRSFNECVRDIESLDEVGYKETTMIASYTRDCASYWLNDYVFDPE